MLRFVLFFLALAAPGFPAEPALRIVSPRKVLTFTATEFAALPHAELTVADPHTHVARKFSGVTVHELLDRAELPWGEKFRGPALALAVVVRAKDGYAVVFALADFDEAFARGTILLADTEGGRPLPEKSAPFQLVVPGDKKAARWARQVVSLEVLSLASPP